MTNGVFLEEMLQIPFFYFFFRHTFDRILDKIHYNIYIIGAKHLRERERIVFVYYGNIYNYR